MQPSSPVSDVIRENTFFQLELVKDPHYSPSPQILTVCLQKMPDFYHASEWLVSQYEVFIYRCV